MGLCTPRLLKTHTYPWVQVPFLTDVGTAMAIATYLYPRHHYIPLPPPPLHTSTPATATYLYPRHCICGTDTDLNR